jgi:hypothetical protein
MTGKATIVVTPAWYVTRSKVRRLGRPDAFFTIGAPNLTKSTLLVNVNRV